jgi:cyclohexa-1,5-dienecarbonyl-CoA hydratase
MPESQSSTDRKFRCIQTERRGHVSWIILNKPPLNIIDMEMMEEIQSAILHIETAQDDGGLQAIAFRGAGKCFSAGVSIQDHRPEIIRDMIPRFHEIFRSLARTEKITLAAVHGVCLGGGFELASMCDLVVAADGAQFGQPEIKLGQLPPVGIILLPYLIGYRKAAELILTGANIDAVQAMALGLVNRVAPEGKVLGAAEALAQEVTSYSGSTLRLAKNILRRVAGLDFEMALEDSEHFFLHTLIHTGDAKEGILAFLEKRAPEWKHR